MADGVHLNGKLTLGENIADNGGVRLALMALLDTLGGKARRRWTDSPRSSACFWASRRSGARTRRRRTRACGPMTDPHSPGKYRVNGVLQNMPEFQKAFACKAGEPMVSPKACRVW